MLRTINKLLAPIQRKLAQVISRGVVNLVNDSLKLQEIQVTLMANETLDGVERIQNYGFTSNPIPGAEAVTVSVNGHRGHSVAIAVDDKRYRLKGLESGEVAIYDDLGNKLVLGRNKISMNAVAQLDITAPIINISASTHINIASPDSNFDGGINTTGDVIANSVSTIHHTHPENDGGDTGEPN